MLTLFEVLLTKNAVDHLKFVSRKRVVISLNGCPFHKCGTRAYQCTKYERIRILGCVRDFFGFYRHLLLTLLATAGRLSCFHIPEVTVRKHLVYSQFYDNEI